MINEENEEIEEIEENPSSTIYIISVIFLVIVTILLFLTLYYYRLSYPSLENFSTNPYCLRVNCTEGEPTYYNVVDDPQQDAWVTLNYCVDNAPSSGLINALTICASNPESTESIFFHSPNSMTPTSSNIEVYSEWYNNTYLENCGFGWIPYVDRPPDGDISRLVNNCRTNGAQRPIAQFQ